MVRARFRINVVFALCCRERVTESDADVVAYSKLSSPLGEHAEQIVAFR